MPRKKKQEVKVNDNASLEGLMQETYDDACLQILDSQRTINELSASIVPEDVDDLTKITKEKAGLLKVKDSAIKIKLELAKLQSDIIKNRGDVGAAINERSQGTVTTDDFAAIRAMITNNKKSDIDSEIEE